MVQISRNIYGTSFCLFCVYIPIIFIMHQSPSTSWTAMIHGIPYLNWACSVLWWKKRIPRNAPRLPPAIANRKSQFSGIRHALFLAKDLSNPKAEKAMRFISTIYDRTCTCPLPFWFFRLLDALIIAQLQVLVQGALGTPEIRRNLCCKYWLIYRKALK